MKSLLVYGILVALPPAVLLVFWLVRRRAYKHDQHRREHEDKAAAASTSESQGERRGTTGPEPEEETKWLREDWARARSDSREGEQAREDQARSEWETSRFEHQTHDHTPAPAPAPFIDPSYAVVQIFYATDRTDTGQKDPALIYGAEHSPDGALSLGTCEVSIPRDHRLGKLEHPSIWCLEFREKPEKHVVLLRVGRAAESAFWQHVAYRVSESQRREAFVFVHGYNTSFEDAARRTAQIAYDLAFDGVPICYSWPSYGELADYPKDENNVQWTVPHLKNFLWKLTNQLDVKTIHIIAHSMGNRAVSHALQLLGAEDAAKLCHMQHIVLTAPDIDADTFKELAVAIKSLAYMVTLYVSPADRALALSKRFHGNPRLGEVISIIPGIDTIDASEVDTSFLGHSYYAENRSVLSDIFWLLKEDKPPKDRFGMRPIDHRDGIYFAFRP